MWSLISLFDLVSHPAPSGRIFLYERKNEKLLLLVLCCCLRPHLLRESIAVPQWWSKMSGDMSNKQGKTCVVKGIGPSVSRYNLLIAVWCQSRHAKAKPDMQGGHDDNDGDEMTHSSCATPGVVYFPEIWPVATKQRVKTKTLLGGRKLTSTTQNNAHGSTSTRGSGAIYVV